jgi:Holliday junction resolvase
MNNKIRLLTDIYNEKMKDNKEIGFNLLTFSMFALPARNPKTDKIIRQLDNGGEIHIQSSKGVPFGRDIVTLHWMTTLSVKYKSRKITGIEVKKDYLDMLGYETDGGKQYLKLKASLERWLTFRSSIFPKTKGENIERGESLSVLAGYRLNKKKPSENFFQLEENFFEKIIEKQIVVIPWKIVKFLKSQPYTLAFLDWLSQRMLRVEGYTIIPIDYLMPAFGAEYKYKKHFKARLKETIRRIKDIWRELDAEIKGDNLILKPSPLLITPKLND